MRELAHEHTLSTRVYSVHVRKRETESGRRREKERECEEEEGRAAGERETPHMSWGDSSPT
jgi:hypothetical protein